MAKQAHPDSYYAASAHPAAERPRLTGALRADVCVVGGGFTGVSVALNLAERGYDVVLLEAERIGWGASGRNGGQICSGISGGMGRVASALGLDDARKVFDMVEEAKAIIRERVERHAIDCDLKWGYLDGAIKPRHLDGMAQMAEAWRRDFGYEAHELLEGADAVAPYVGTKAYRGGLLDRGAGHLHPLNYCLGLARAAEAAGVRLFEGSRVTSVETGAKPAAVTAEGRVKADSLVLCGNAYLGDLVPQIGAKIMPMGNYIGATEPLGEARAQALIPADIAVCDWKFILNYYRLSADRRLLWGGLASYSTLPPPNLRQGLWRQIHEVFPDLQDVAFDYTWGGLVGITMERTPHFGRLGSSVYFAQGYSGSGVALSGLAGRIVAEAVAGQAERLDLFARLPHTTFPGGRLLRMPTLVLAMTWFRLRDWLP